MWLLSRVVLYKSCGYNCTKIEPSVFLLLSYMLAHKWWNKWLRGALSVAAQHPRPLFQHGRLFVPSIVCLPYNQHGTFCTWTNCASASGTIFLCQVYQVHKCFTYQLDRNAATVVGTWAHDLVLGSAMPEPLSDHGWFEATMQTYTGFTDRKNTTIKKCTVLSAKTMIWVWDML